MKNTNPDFQPLTFTDGLYDADTKLIRFGARDYDPTVGRWTTKDPIGFAGGDTNLYAYVGGNPMSKFDPTGTSDIDLFSFEKDPVLNDNSKNTINAYPYFSVGGHGSSRVMVDQLGRKLTPAMLAAIILANPGYKKGQPIQLNSCSTGGNKIFEGEVNYAQQLANILGVDVMAPTDWANIWEDGSITIRNGGQWKIHLPSPVPIKQ